jgi:hypothetical protein
MGVDTGKKSFDCDVCTNTSLKEVGSAPAHLICVDGEILKIPPRGRAKCSLLSGVDRVELEVYGGI